MRIASTFLLPITAERRKYLHAHAVHPKAWLRLMLEVKEIVKYRGERERAEAREKV